MVDSNIVIGVWIGNAAAKAHLSRAMRGGSLSICPVVHAELFAHPGMSKAAITAFLSQTGISIAHIPQEVFALAGRRLRFSQNGVDARSRKVPDESLPTS